MWSAARARTLRAKLSSRASTPCGRPSSRATLWMCVGASSWVTRGLSAGARRSRGSGRGDHIAARAKTYHTAFDQARVSDDRMQIPCVSTEEQKNTPSIHHITTDGFWAPRCVSLSTSIAPQRRRARAIGLRARECAQATAIAIKEHEFQTVNGKYF